MFKTVANSGSEVILNRPAGHARCAHATTTTGHAHTTSSLWHVDANLTMALQYILILKAEVSRLIKWHILGDFMRHFENNYQMPVGLYSSTLQYSAMTECSPEILTSVQRNESQTAANKWKQLETCFRRDLPSSTLGHPHSITPLMSRRLLLFFACWDIADKATSHMGRPH